MSWQTFTRAAKVVGVAALLVLAWPPMLPYPVIRRRPPGRHEAR